MASNIISPDGIGVRPILAPLDRRHTACTKPLRSPGTGDGPCSHGADDRYEGHVAPMETGISSRTVYRTANMTGPGSTCIARIWSNCYSLGNEE